MLRSRCWLGSLSLPILIASLGCSIGHRPNAQANGRLPPERLMVMAQAFERQGRIPQAKNAYRQILAVDPDFPNARQSLDTLIASEANPNRSRFDLSKVPTDRIVAKGRLEVDKTSSVAERKRANPSVTEDVVKAETKRIVHESDTGKADFKTSKTVDSDFDRSTADSTPGSQKADLIAIQTVDHEKSSESQIDPMILLSDEKPNRGSVVGESVVREDDKSVNTTPELNEIVSKPDDADQWPVLAEETPPLTELPRDVHPLEEPAMPPQVVQSERSVPSSDEPGEFVKPGIRFDRVKDVELSKLFGPFRVEMVQILKENRDRFQPQLIEIACDRQAKIEVRSRSILLLGEVGRDAVDALPALRHQMHEVSDPFLKVDLCEAILKIQPEDEDAIRSLVKSLTDSNSEVRWIAVFALRNAVSPRTTFVIDSLREAIKTDDLKLRRMVFLTLGEFGPAASAALPELYSALDCNDRATREVAKAALESIAPNRVLKQVVE